MIVLQCVVVFPNFFHVRLKGIIQADILNLMYNFAPVWLQASFFGYGGINFLNREQQNLKIVNNLFLYLNTYQFLYQYFCMVVVGSAKLFFIPSKLQSS